MKARRDAGTDAEIVTGLYRTPPVSATRVEAMGMGSVPCEAIRANVARIPQRNRSFTPGIAARPSDIK